jgi:hypothetical protein
MTKKEGVLLASRAFALYLVFWGLSDVTYLPQNLLSLRYHYAAHGYWLTYYCIEFTFRVVRIIALFAAANWLYTSGKRVEGFFFPPEELGKVEPN